MVYTNVSPHTLTFAGVPYPPGSTIPATADPAQLAYFATQGVVVPTTAPVAPDPPLRRVSSKPSSTLKEAPHADSDAD